MKSRSPGECSVRPAVVPVATAAPAVAAAATAPAVAAAAATAPAVAAAAATPAVAAAAASTAAGLETCVRRRAILPFAVVPLGLELHLLPLLQVGAPVGTVTVDLAMDEYVLAAVVWGDEPEPLVCEELLHGPRWHAETQ